MICGTLKWQLLNFYGLRFNATLTDSNTDLNYYN